VITMTGGWHRDHRSGSSKFLFLPTITTTFEGNPELPRSRRWQSARLERSLEAECVEDALQVANGVGATAAAVGLW
jgi:hypothetical protein